MRSLDALTIIGTSFKQTGFVDLSGWTLPVAFRGFALQELRERYGADEAIYLSTCNRSELIIWGRSEFSARRVTRRWREWAARGGQPISSDSDLTVRRGVEAARYLFEVAASLDSLVVGETEILRQLRAAHAASRAACVTGRRLNAVIERAIKTGKEVRHRTSLASLSTSVVSVALREIRRRTAGRRLERAVVIGAGETGKAVSRALRSAGARTIAIANRTVARAQSLAETVQGRAFPLDEVPELVAGADVVVSAAAVPTTLVDPAMIPVREGRPLLLVDLAIPSNIDPACADLPGVSLIGLPELERIASANQPLLDKEVERASEIVESGLDKLAADFRMASHSDFLRRSREALLTSGGDEISALLAGELSDLDPARRAAVEKRLQGMVRRLTHLATDQFKQQLREPPR